MLLGYSRGRLLLCQRICQSEDFRCGLAPGASVPRLSVTRSLSAFCCSAPFTPALLLLLPLRYCCSRSDSCCCCCWHCYCCSHLVSPLSI